MTNNEFEIVAETTTTVPKGLVELQVVPTDPERDLTRITYKDWKSDPQGDFKDKDGQTNTWIAPDNTGTYTLNVTVREAKKNIAPPPMTITVVPAGQAMVDVLREGLPGRTIRLARQSPDLSPEKTLWVIIRNRTAAISFKNYKAFIDAVMCGDSSPVKRERLPTRLEKIAAEAAQLRYRGSDQYEVLKKATEAFLMQETGMTLQTIRSTEPQEEKRRLPQLEDVETELDKNRDDYLQILEGECQTFPYFKQILEKLSDLPLKPPEAVEAAARGTAPPATYQTSPVPEQTGCYGILRSRICPPILLELIWSYWHEEGMLVQTMNAISMRYQNRRGRKGDGEDPLANLAIDPLRPLSNLIWGYIQDEQHRLGVVRRAYEYDHHYGFSLVGKAVPKLRPADSRTKFLEAFHNLLHVCCRFYREAADTTVIPDGFLLLNAVQEVHLILAQGAENQFGDLPWTARIEMLIEQWLLARPEMRDFLSGRIMVPYPEPWMDRVDTMKKLQGWGDTSVTAYRALGVLGEQILLTVRYGDWTNINNPDDAANWALYWRAEIQNYIHAYKAVTGVDLCADVVEAQMARQRNLPPSEHLRRRMGTQART